MPTILQLSHLQALGTWDLYPRLVGIFVVSTEIGCIVFEQSSIFPSDIQLEQGVPTVHKSTCYYDFYNLVLFSDLQSQLNWFSLQLTPTNRNQMSQKDKE